MITPISWALQQQLQNIQLGNMRDMVDQSDQRATRKTKPGPVHKDSLVTAEMIEGLNPCPEGLERFKRVWPNGIVLTRSALIDSARAGLDIEWFGFAALAHDPISQSRLESEVSDLEDAAHVLYPEMAPRHQRQQPPFIHRLAEVVWEALPDEAPSPQTRTVTRYVVQVGGFYLRGDNSDTPTKPENGSSFPSPAAALVFATRNLRAHSGMNEVPRTAGGIRNMIIEDELMEHGIKIVPIQVEV